MAASALRFHSRTLLWALCGCVLPFVGVSQHGSFRVMTIDDGLVMNWIRGFHQDRHGFVWIYTYEGISRFEGTRFRNFLPGDEIAHGVVNDMWEAPNGDLYIPLNDGSIEVFRDLHRHQSDTAKHFVVNFFRTVHGEVFSGTDVHGLKLFQNGEFITVIPELANETILDLVEKDDILYLMGTDKFHIYRMQDSDSGPPEFEWIDTWESPVEYFNTTLVHPGGRVLVGTAKGVSEVVANTDKTAFDLRSLDVIPHDWTFQNVLSMAVSGTGEMWYATYYGLLHTSPGQPDRLYTMEDGLPSNKVYTLMIDRNNILWIGTDAGVAQLHLRSPVTYLPIPRSSIASFVLAAPDGSVHGVADNFIRYTITGNTVSLTEYPDRVIGGLVLNDNGLHMLFGQTIETDETIRSGDPAVEITTPQNVLGQGDRIYWCDNDAILVYSFTTGTVRQVFEHRRVEALAALNDSTLLLGTWNSGIFFVRISDTDPTAFHVLRHLTDLPGNEIRSLMVSRSGDIWAGTRHDGLLRIRCGDDIGQCDIDVYNTSSGTVSNWITALAEDVYGHLWAGSVSGLMQLIPDGEDYAVYPVSKAYGVTDRIMQIAPAPDSTMIFVTSSHFGRIRPNDVIRSLPEQTYITDIYVNNQRRTGAGGTLRLNHRDNNLHFEFATPAQYTATEPPYTYRLMGSHDTSWSVPLYAPVLNFANLNPGTYTFEVAHLSWSGVRGPSARYYFEILPPFWMRWWFIVLSAVLLILLLVGLYFLRIRQIRRMQQVRDRIAADLHDEIGSSLTHVNILAAIGRNGDEKQSDILERIGKEAQSSAEALDDIIWSVKDRTDVIEDVIARMRQYATEVFGSSDTTFRMSEKTEGAGDMNLEQRRDLYLIFKELLRNIHRHASARHVTMSIRIDRHQITLVVTDDGKGFDPHMPTQRNGLKNIRKRVDRWKGIVTWDTKKGSGTTARVEMKRQ